MLRLNIKKLLTSVAIFLTFSSISSFGSEDLKGVWEGKANINGLESFSGCAHDLKLQVEITDSSIISFAFTPLSIICGDKVIGGIFFGELDVFYNPVFNYSTFHVGNTVLGWKAENAVSIVLGSPDENLSMDLKLSLSQKKLLAHVTLGTRKSLYVMVTSEMEKKTDQIPLAPESDFPFPKTRGFKLGSCDSSKTDTLEKGNCY